MFCTIKDIELKRRIKFECSSHYLQAHILSNIFAFSLIILYGVTTFSLCDVTPSDITSSLVDLITLIVKVYSKDPDLWLIFNEC